MLESLDLPFVQRGLAEVALLSVGAGLIGTWVVLRGLAFHSHAAGTAAFPGLVLADGLGFAASLGALGAAALFALGVGAFGRGREEDRGAAVALALVGMLALGVILASDVFSSSAGIEGLLFGSLFLVGGGDLALAGATSAIALVAALLAGRHWVAAGFDPDAPGPSRASRRALDLALLGLVALGTVAALSAVGALLVSALFVVPAATTRLWTSRMAVWQLSTIALCAALGVAAVLLSVELNSPPGATLAVLSGGAFAAAAIARVLARGPGRPVRWVGLAALVLLLPGCGGDDSKAVVVATTPVVGDIAQQVAGEGIEVRTLLAPNTDPHEYEPRPDDIQALADAEVVVAGGGDVDAWIEDAVADSGSDAEPLMLGESIPHPRANEDGELDPHWWHDPRNAAAAVAATAEALESAVPAEAEAIERRAREYEDRIGALDERVADCFGRVPARERKLVTDHDAFGYLADRYGLELVGAIIPSRTTEAQPSAGELAELRAAIESEGVRAVFAEASVSQDVAGAIAAETGAELGPELYGDTLGEAGSEGETYLGMVAANARSIASALTGGAVECDTGEQG